MPILRDFRTTRAIELPSWPGSKVEIYDSLLVGDMLRIDFKDGGGIEQTISALEKFIKSWNFTDDKGQPLEVNRDNLNFLTQEDLNFLAAQIADLHEQAKKKPSS